MIKPFRVTIIFIYLLMFNTLLPLHVSAANNSCNVTTVINPPLYTITEDSIWATVPFSTNSITLALKTSSKSTWKVYKDLNCTKEISNNLLKLNVGHNIAYIKVIAQGKTTSKKYTLTVIRKALSNACEITAVTLPFGAAIGVNTVSATVPINTSKVKLHISTSSYAIWQLYRDANCTKEIKDNELSLNVGINNAYIKVTAQDKTTIKRYSLRITRSSIPVSIKCDVTTRVNVLGQPFLAKGLYPANVWDMQVFKGKIYLGFGNSSNLGPTGNVGPIPIIYVDPSTGKFKTEDIKRYNSTVNAYENTKAVDEEQIDIYKVMDGKLYIPGHDSRESWDFGNYYINEGNIWRKVRNLPNGVHVYDMAYFKGTLFAALGTNQYQDENNTNAVVVMSVDNGLSWYKAGSIPVSIGYDGRVYTLFELKNTLYAVDKLSRFRVFGINGIEYHSTVKILSFKPDTTGKIIAKAVTVNTLNMLPGLELATNEATSIKLVRINAVNDKLQFIAGQSHNDHQWLSKGLYVASDLNSALKICLPDQGTLPMDTLVRGNTTYVLAHQKISNKEYTNIVYYTNDLKIWTELFSFKSNTFARSFEELNGDFYFGLGCNTDYLSPCSGTILMVKSNAYWK